MVIQYYIITGEYDFLVVWENDNLIDSVALLNGRNINWRFRQPENSAGIDDTRSQGGDGKD